MPGRCLAMLTLIVIAGPATARDVFVDNVGGDDRARGETLQSLVDLGGAVRTITKALRLAQPGDQIVLTNTGQPYRECVSLVSGKHSASAVAPFRIQGNGATLDGSQPVPTLAWLHDQGDVFRFRPDRLAHQQLFLNDRPAVRRPAALPLGSPPDLGSLEWALVGSYLYFRVPTGELPETRRPSYAALQTGITLYHVQGVEISDLIVQGFQLDGVNVFDAATDVVLEGLTCRGNGRSGVSVGGASQAVVHECLLGDNGVAQIRTEGVSQTHVVDSQLIANTAPATVVVAGRLWVDGQAAHSTEPLRRTLGH